MNQSSIRRVTFTSVRSSVFAAWRTGLFASALTAALAAGCGSAVDDGDVASAEQAFSQASCGSATADQTFTGMVDPAFITPRSYTTCFKSYVVEINNFSSAYTGLGGGGCPAATISVTYGDTPLTAANCASTEVAAIYYEKRNGSWVVLNEVHSFGTWIAIGSGGSCSIGTGQTGMVAGRSYRVAMTARDPSGNTRKVSLQTVKRVVCQ
jgi:hypothetical protein